LLWATYAQSPNYHLGAVLSATRSGSVIAKKLLKGGSMSWKDDIFYEILKLRRQERETLHTINQVQHTLQNCSSTIARTSGLTDFLASLEAKAIALRESIQIKETLIS
jgi:hypothetical protein